MKKKAELPSIDLDQIIGYCQQTFVNIVPNTGTHTSQVKPTQIIHETDEIRLIMKQLSIFLQLTIQNCVLTSNPKVKSDSYRILGNFSNLLSRDLDDFQNLIHHRNKTKLPFYEIDCKDFVGRELSIKVPPQVSLYQDPLLFYNYCRTVQDELFCNMPIVKTRQDRIQIIRRHVPFLDPKFIPIVGQRLETKAKFTELEDRLLLIMLSLHEKKDIGRLKKIYFPNRQEAQIKNRAKNLCAKQLSNPVKKLRQNEFLPLNDEERKTLIRAFKRFGDRWPVMAKYYELRSAQFLKSEYEDDQKLARLRKSYNIQVNYTSIKETIQEELNKEQQQGGKHDFEHQVIDIEEEHDKMSEQSEPQYKIINHLTFLYEEI